VLECEIGARLDSGHTYVSYSGYRCQTGYWTYL
jgi:hypothetical protein